MPVATAAKVQALKRDFKTGAAVAALLGVSRSRITRWLKGAGIDPAALQVVQKGLWEATHLPFGTSYPVFGHFPVPIAGKTGTAEKVVALPGYFGLQNQSWWCGYGPTSDAKLVVCAVIENGGHGGTAAAPAAAQVFASFFHVKIALATASHSD